MKWRVNWYTSRGKGSAGVFQALGGSVEEVAVDVETLVASANRLTSRGKLPAALIKEATRIVKGAEVAEHNGTTKCVVCDVDGTGDELVQCDCCGKVYHTSCAPGWDAGSPKEWWCQTCEPQGV